MSLDLTSYIIILLIIIFVYSGEEFVGKNDD